MHIYAQVLRDVDAETVFVKLRGEEGSGQSGTLPRWLLLAENEKKVS